MRRALLLMLCFVLAGCVTSGKRGNALPLDVYDFGRTGTERSAEPLSATVALEVRVPLWIDGVGIAYRLAYVDVSRLHDYSRARWAGPPSQLIQLDLEHRLGLARVGQLKTGCVLRLEVAEFSQHFDSPASSRAVLLGRLLLLDRQRREIAAKPLRIEVPAATADARGGAQALSATVDRLAAQILAWGDTSGPLVRAARCAS